LLLPTTTYRADAFVNAAGRLDVDLTVASEIPSSLQALNPVGLLTLSLHEPDVAVVQAMEFARHHSIDAVVGVDDDTAVVAAMIAGALGLSGNPVSSVRAARDKHQQRVLYRTAGLAVPAFRLSTFEEDLARCLDEVIFPAVVKPLSLSASRGVMRVDDAPSLLHARERLRGILREAESDDTSFLIEEFVSGPECAVEGLVTDGALRVLAVFDKPDPLDGPFFEETIYVTPSRLSDRNLSAISECVAKAVEAIGLVHGPIHAEIRLAARGPVLIEMAARPIGGKCSRALCFGTDGSVSLEELILRHALRDGHRFPKRAPGASGVMMIPTPRAGTLRDVSGRDAALAVPGIVDVLITVPRGARLVPLPEGSRYLGFIFARAEMPAQVESALRTAFASLTIDVAE